MCRLRENNGTDTVYFSARLRHLHRLLKKSEVEKCKCCQLQDVFIQLLNLLNNFHIAI